MLYIGIPSHNEASTVGLLLWRLKSVLQDTSREYEILVYDDGSTDGTADLLKSYSEVLPLTVLGGAKHVGYAGALEALVRAAAERTRYPRRDGLLTMQADFTDRPEDLPEMVKRFEGGADIVVGERQFSPTWPRQPRMLQRFAPWLGKPLKSLVDVKDPFGTLRIYRISVLRELLQKLDGAPIIGPLTGWTANARLLVQCDRFARRIETVPSTPQYELRPRESRLRPWSAAYELYRGVRAITSSTKKFTVPA